MSFKIFRILFPKSTIATLHATKNSVILKTYNQSSKQLSVHRVRLRHKDKNAKCRFFVVLGIGPALLGMLGIELLNVLKIMGD